MMITLFIKLISLMKSLFFMHKCFLIRYLNIMRALQTCKNTLLFISIFLKLHIAILDVHKNVSDIYIKRYYDTLYHKTFNYLKP